MKTSRLEPVETQTIKPFIRSTEVTDCSLYWMPVTSYPMNALQRRWLLEFCERLAKRLKEEKGLREEVFLHFKSLYPDLIDRFSERAVDFAPISGAAVTPGKELPKPIDMEDLRAKVDEASRNGTLLDVQQWMPDHLYWFAKKKAVEQRQAFYGVGGMLSLYLKPDASTAIPVLELPRFVRTAPGFSDDITRKLQDDIDMTYSLQDSFLAKSKAMFAGRLRETPSYKGLLFALPFFQAEPLLQATPLERAAWFEVFDGYMVESPQDKGVLLMLHDAAFDETLAEIVEQMKKDDYVYRI